MRSSSNIIGQPVPGSADNHQTLQPIEVILDDLRIIQPVVDSSTNPKLEVNVNLESTKQENIVTCESNALTNLTDENQEANGETDTSLFDLIPQEVALRIFNLVNPPLVDLLAWQLVSRAFNHLSKDDTVWKKRFQMHFLYGASLYPENNQHPYADRIEALYSSALNSMENEIDSNENVRDSETAIDSENAIDSNQNVIDSNQDELDFDENALESMENDSDLNESTVWYNVFREASRLYNTTFTNIRSIVRFNTPQEIAKYANFFAWAKENAAGKFVIMSPARVPTYKISYQDFSVRDIYGMTLKDWALKNGSQDVLKVMFRVIRDNPEIVVSEKLIYAIRAKEPAKVVWDLLSSVTSDMKAYLTRIPKILITAFEHGTSETAELIASILIKNSQNVIDVANASGLLAYAIENERIDVANNLLGLIIRFNKSVEEEARTREVAVDEDKKVKFKDALLQAILQSKRDMVVRLLKLLPSDTTLHGDEFDILAKSSLDVVRIMVEYNPRIIDKSKFLKSILAANRKDLINFCTEVGVPRMRILRLAIANRHLNPEDFLYSGINFHEVNEEDNLNILRLAISHAQLSLLPYILLTDPTILNGQEGVNAWFDLIMRGGIDIDYKLSMLNHFLEIRPDLINETRNGMTALMLACFHHAHEMAKFLIEKGADLNIENNDDVQNPKTALYYAANPLVINLNNVGADLLADYAPTCMIEILMLNGVDLLRRFNGKSILHLLAHNDDFTNVDIIDRIVELYPDLLNSVDNNGNTPLAVAMTNPNNLILAYALAKLGANPNVKLHTPQGATNLLYLAAARYDSEIIKILLTNGASRKEGVQSCKEHLTGRRLNDAVYWINSMKLSIGLDNASKAQRKTAKAIKNTALILQDVKNGQYTQHVSKWKRFRKKIPAQTSADAAITHLSSVLGNTSLFYKNQFNKDEKKIIKSFPKLEKIYKRMR